MTRGARALLALLAAGLTAAALAPATAGAALLETDLCDDAELSQPFARWGDRAAYKLAPGGDFESGAQGWTLAGGAKLVSGGSPFAATGVPSTRAVAIPPGGSVTSPATCVNAAYPTIRSFVRSQGGLLGLAPLLRVDLLYRDGLLGLIPVPAGIVTLSSSWTPTAPMLTLSAVGAAVAGGEAPLAVRFTSMSGTWTVDDVFVDPYRRS